MNIANCRRKRPRAGPKDMRDAGGQRLGMYSSVVIVNNRGSRASGDIGIVEMSMYKERVYRDSA